MVKNLTWVLCLTVTLFGCGTISQHQRLEQPTAAELRAYVGGTILKIEITEDLPNAFGGKDIWGGKRPKGSIELKYLGLAEEGRVKLRVVSTDVETSENWRRRLRREGYATSTSDAVDFEHDPAKAFIMEGFQVEFIESHASSVRYRIMKAEDA